MKLLKTGIVGFDEFLQGGLPPGVFLLIGPLGSGSEIFAREIAYSRAKDSGVTYFTLTKPTEVVKDDMSAYGWDISQLEEAERWRFINLTQTESMIDDIIQEMKQSRCVVLDSFSELLLTQKIEDAISLLISMSTQNRECQELHLILLTEGMQDPKVETTMQHFADGVITFTTNWGTEATSRSIIIKKMRRMIIPSRSLPYSIGERGFTIETAIRIT